MSEYEEAVQVAHPDADAISFVGQEDRGVVQLCFLNLEEKRPVGLIAEFDIDIFEDVIESATAAKLDAEGAG